MHHLEIEVEISFKSKWHCGSGEGGVLVDRLLSRDSRGLPYVPGSTLKGVVRESCEKLSRALRFPEPCDPHLWDIQKNPGLFSPLREVRSPVDAVFGNKYEEGGIIFRDARLDEKTGPRQFFSQTRARRYRRLGTTAEKQLFSSEYAVPLTLKTTIGGHHRHLVCFEPPDAEDPEYPPYGYSLLVAGILGVERLGGDKSTGSGSVTLRIESFVYNGKSFDDLGKILEPLDPEFYEESLIEQMRATREVAR